MAGVEQMDNILSIHAPTRGATQLLLSFGLGHFIFQSTLLQEERPFIDENALTKQAFNPRSYKRSDQLRRSNFP